MDAGQHSEATDNSSQMNRWLFAFVQMRWRLHVYIYIHIYIYIIHIHTHTGNTGSGSRGQVSVAPSMDLSIYHHQSSPSGAIIPLGVPVAMCHMSIFPLVSNRKFRVVTFY